MSHQLFAFEAAAFELCSLKKAAEQPILTDHLEHKQRSITPSSLDRFRSPRSKVQSRASLVGDTTTTIKSNKNRLPTFNDEIQRSPSLSNNNNDRSPRQFSLEHRSSSHRPSLPDLSQRTSSRPPKSSLSSRESRCRPFYASLSFMEHRALDASANVLPTETSQIPLPDLELLNPQKTHELHAVNSIEPLKLCKPIKEPKLAPVTTNLARPKQTPTKKSEQSSGDKFSSTIRQIFHRQLRATITPAQVVRCETQEDDYNPFALDLTLEISKDKSELDYLRRTQKEECLEWQRTLFAMKDNITTTTKEKVATALTGWASIAGMELIIRIKELRGGV